MGHGFVGDASALRMLADLTWGELLALGAVEVALPGHLASARVAVASELEALLQVAVASSLKLAVDVRTGELRASWAG
ncbi:hypothetical protein [Microbacterium sp.]|uniref:hypothetical protein n=1 Tax=Microbacterium sp. TaxID=51671 RepID=UPI0026283340|nr:hypothetical protein [Microbacterium sp.]